MGVPDTLLPTRVAVGVVCSSHSSPAFLSSSPSSMCKLPGRLKLLLFLSPFFLSVAASTNFTQCLDTFRASGNATGGTDFFGRPVNNSQDAVSLTYNVCKSLCGTGQEAFNWSVFSQQFSAWLLPWLALVSQLPFGAENRLDNLLSGEFLVV